MSGTLAQPVHPIIHDKHMNTLCYYHSFDKGVFNRSSYKLLLQQALLTSQSNFCKTGFNGRLIYFQ